MSNVTERNEDPKEMSVAGPSMPSWLTEHIPEEDKSTIDMVGFFKIPIAKIIQSNIKDKKIKEKYGEGSVITTPGNELIVTAEREIHVIPVFFFLEFGKWKDNKDTGNKTVMERTKDRNSVIAKKAFNRLKEPYGDKFEAQYSVHFNTVFLINEPNHSLSGTPILQSWNRGGTPVGEDFCSKAQSKFIGEGEGRKKVPLWMQRFVFYTKHIDIAQGSWYEMQFKTADRPYVNQAEMQDSKEMHLALQEHFLKGTLEIDESGDTSYDKEKDLAKEEF